MISIIGLAFLLIPTQSAHSESFAFLEVSFDSSFAKGGVYEYYGAVVQEKNGSQTRAFTSRPSNGNFKFTVPISEDPWKLYLSILEPGAEKDGEAFAGRYPQKNNVGVTALTVKSIKIDKDLALTVKVPVSQKRISVKVLDASGSLITDSFSQASLTEKYTFTQSGLSWELESRVHANGETTYSTSGNFQYYFYEGTSFTLKVWDKGRSTEVATPKSIKVSKDLEVVMCLPLNFPAGVRSLSPDCLQVQMQEEIQALNKAAADKAASDKAAADKAASDKAAADKAASDKAAADKAASDKAASDKAATDNAAYENRLMAAKSKYSALSLEIESLIKKYPSKKSEIELYKKKIALFERIDQANISTVELNLAGIESKLVAMRSIYSKITRTITCTKGTKSLKVFDVNPKCPTGYKKK